MSPAESIRAEMRRLIRSAPFRPFVINLTDGGHGVIERPENIAFDPVPGGAKDFYVISGPLRLYRTFTAVSSIALADRDGAAA